MLDLRPETISETNICDFHPLLGDVSFTISFMLEFSKCRVYLVPQKKRGIKPTERDWPWRPFYEIVIIVTPFLRQEVMRKKINGEEKNWTRYKMKVIFSRFKTKANGK